MAMGEVNCKGRDMNLGKHKGMISFFAFLAL